MPPELRQLHDRPPDESQVVGTGVLAVGVETGWVDRVGVPGAQPAGGGVHVGDDPVAASVSARDGVCRVIAAHHDEPVEQVVDRVLVARHHPDPSAIGSDILRVGGDDPLGIELGQRDQGREGLERAGRIEEGMGALGRDDLAGLHVGQYIGHMRQIRGRRHAGRQIGHHAGAGQRRTADDVFRRDDRADHGTGWRDNTGASHGTPVGQGGYPGVGRVFAARRRWLADGRSR